MGGRRQPLRSRADGLERATGTAHHRRRDTACARGCRRRRHGGGATCGPSGAQVVGTASERNHDYLRSLGAVPVAYGDGLAARVRELCPNGIDAALDGAGGEAITASLELVADRDRIGTLVDQAAADKYGIRRLRGTRSAQILAELAELCASGALRLPVSKTFPLKDAAEAHREMETGHVRGKIALLMD
jgi:enoyl reductase